MGGQRGAPAPLPHCGDEPVTPNQVTKLQRGAPAPLPHCGYPLPEYDSLESTQRGAPAPLPHCGTGEHGPARHNRNQRGAPAPLPHCGLAEYSSREDLLASTRGAGAPPSLRRIPKFGTFEEPGRNEGRRRPSLIAAYRSPSVIAAAPEQRGAPAPLPHCGGPSGRNKGWQVQTTRGAGAPPSLRRDLRALPGLNLDFQRGAPAPLPHCGTHTPISRSTVWSQRGAPAPLPHCGPHYFKRIPHWHYNEGRRRPSLIAAVGPSAPPCAGPFNEGRRRPSLIAA